MTIPSSSSWAIGKSGQSKQASNQDFWLHEGVHHARHPPPGLPTKWQEVSMAKRSTPQHPSLSRVFARWCEQHDQLVDGVSLHCKTSLHRTTRRVTYHHSYLLVMNSRWAVHVQHFLFYKLKALWLEGRLCGEYRAVGTDLGTTAAYRQPSPGRSSTPTCWARHPAT